MLKTITIVINEAKEGWKNFSKIKNNKFEKIKLKMEIEPNLYKKLINYYINLTIINWIKYSFNCYLTLLILSIIKSKITDKKLKLNSKTVLSVKLLDKISWIKKKINAKNNGKIKGTIILKGL